MPAVRPVVSVWSVECSSCRAQGELAARNGICRGVLAIAREQELQAKLEPWKIGKEEL